MTTRHSAARSPGLEACPCGTGRPYASCCGPLHEGAKAAATAEALMRSRYSAFARANGPYIVATQAPELTTDSAEAIAAEARRVEWRGLRILRVENGAESDARGVVEFEARYAVDGREQVMREVSRFDRVGGRWRYVEGRLVPARPRS